MGTKRILIAGASGLVGSAAVERFLASEDDWDVVALSRRAPEAVPRGAFRHLAADLCDPAATRAALADLGGVSHVVFAALYEKPGLVAGWSEADYRETNAAMLKNLLEPLATSALEHVSLLQGTKAYGFHLGPMAIPARERSPRHPHENFYWLQEDYLRERSRAEGWGWTVLRPHLVIGGAYGVAMNLPPVIGAYGAICREEGLDFGFPGGATAPWESTDARVVAGALEWAATAPQAVGEIFNVTNGEVFGWRDLWPALAEALGLPVAADTPRALATFLPEHASTWDRIVARHELRPTSMAELLGQSHFLADLVFAPGSSEMPQAAFESTIKIRQAGFAECMDTEAMWRHWLGDLAARRVLPSAPMNPNSSTTRSVKQSEPSGGQFV
jgi:nucleoside-diphosphate-sugar epimerase